MPQEKKKKTLEEMFPGFTGGVTTSQTPSTTPIPSPSVDPNFQKMFPGLGNIKIPTTTFPEVQKKEGYLGKVVSTISPAIDILSRGQYASAKFFDSFSDESKDMLDILGDSLKEAISPKERLSFSDVLTKKAPRFAAENPKATAILGFIGDVVLDPTSYLGVGLAKTGISIGGKVLTKAGEEILQAGIKQASRKVFVAPQKVLNILDAESKIIKKFGKEYAGFGEESTKILTENGYFTEVSRRTDEIVDFFGDKISKQSAKQLAEEEIHKDLIRNFAKKENREYLESLGTIKTAEQKVGFDSPEFFRYLKQNVAEKGTEGITKEAFPDVVRYVSRNKEGNPTGILEMYLDENGKVINANIGTDKALRKKSIAVELYKQAKQDGYVIGKGSVSGLTPQGAKFVKKQLDTEYKNLTNLYEYEVRETVENRIQKVFGSSPDAFKLFEKEGLRLKVGLPFGKQYDIPGSREFLKSVGLDFLQRNIASIPTKLRTAATKAAAIPVVGKAVGGVSKVVDVVGEAFSKNYNLPDEYIEVRTDLENAFDSIADSVRRTTKQMFDKIDSNRREELGKLMWKIDDETRLLEDKLGRFATNEEATGVIDREILAAKLSPDEMAVVSSMYQDYKSAAQLEMRANLLRNNIQNYSPRAYEVLKNPSEVSFLQRNKFGLSTFLPSSMARSYKTMAEAVEAGLVPEFDAALLYAQRMLQSQRKLATAHFYESIGGIFGKEIKSMKDLDFLPDRIKNDLRLLGDAVYPAGMNTVMKDFLRAFDIASGKFRRYATALKPSFAPRQGISNSVQAAMIIGVKAFKKFDPRAAMDAGLILLDRGKETKNLPDFVLKLFDKNGVDTVLAQRAAMARITGEERLLDYTKDFRMRAALGQEYTGEEVVKMAREYGVIRGFDTTGDLFARKLQKELAYNQNSISSVTYELAKYMNWPAITEDYSRMMLFMNGLRMGYSGKEASKLVNKALFDYARGLSYMEKNVIRRIVPFYTFQRFAIPFVFKQAMKQPGTVATSEKFVKLLEKLFTNQQLNPKERDIFGDTFLVETPRVYSGFDKDGKATFNVFNNLTPLDVLSFFVYDKRGNIDYERTAEKSVLAAITPFIKVPLEMLMPNNKGGRGRVFFTQQTLEDAAKLGDVNDATLFKVLPQPVKDAIGWEARVNEKTGRASVYVNPYLAHTVFNFIPGLKTFIKPLDAGKSALDNAMDIILGINVIKLDLKQQQQFQALSTKKEVDELKRKLRSAKIRGSKSDFEEAQEALKDLVISVKESKELKDQVRGAGMSSINQPAQTTITEQPFK